MFGLGGNNEDDQRLWNLLIFKVPMSDKELENASPIFLIILVNAI